MIESGQFRSVARASRWTGIGRYLAGLKRIPNTLTSEERRVLSSRLLGAIDTNTEAIRRSIDGRMEDVFWSSVALYVVLEYQLSTVQSSRIVTWPVRTDTRAPVTRRMPGMRYKVPPQFEHIHNTSILHMANKMGSAYARM